MRDIDKFKLARELIRDEDGLVNNRVNWLLVFQGFLFTAFVGGVGLYEKMPVCYYTLITVGLILIGVFGIVSSFVAMYPVVMAAKQLYSVKTWWLNQLKNADEFPPIAGDIDAVAKSKHAAYRSGRNMICLSLSIPAVVWLVLIYLVLIGGCSSGHVRTEQKSCICCPENKT